MSDFDTLSPEQAAELPKIRDALMKAIKDASDAAAKLGSTGNFHVAGQLRFALDAVRVVRSNVAGESDAIILPIEMIGVGPVTELSVDAMSLIAAVAQTAKH